MLIELAVVNTLNCSIKARRILCRSGIFRHFKRIHKLQFSIVMHLEKLLLESFTSNSFNAGPFKLIEADINITTSFIAVLPFCNSGSNHLTNLKFDHGKLLPFGRNHWIPVLTRLSMRIDEVNDLVLDVGSDHCLSLKLKISLQYSASKLESAALRWIRFFCRPTDLARNSWFRLKEPF